MPKEVSKAACQEVVLTGDDVDLDLLPIQRCWPLDPRPFITLPAVITKDREPGCATSACTACRRSTVGRRSCTGRSTRTAAPTCSLRPTGASRSPSRIGLDPVTAYSASAPLPKHVGELMLAGFLKGSPVQLVRCKTVELEVPANAEIVLEGWVDASDVGEEGPVRRPHRLLHPAPRSSPSSGSAP